VNYVTGEDVQVSGKNPTMLAREIERTAFKYINNPSCDRQCKIILMRPLSEQVRVIGESQLTLKSQ